MKIDFHVHTDLSPCAAMKPSLALKVAKKKGLDAIAIVNHNKLLKFNPKGFKVIPGEEVRSRDGEIIGLFLKDKVPEGLSAQETINLIKNQGGVVIMPHVFDSFRRGVGGLINELNGYDFIELNGRCLLKSFNDKAKAFANHSKTPLIGSSDAHYYPELGHVYTEIKASSINEAMNELLKGRGRVVFNKLGLVRFSCYFKSIVRSAYKKSLKKVL